MFIRWLGTQTFIAGSTVSGLAIGYFAFKREAPLVFLILVLWLLSMVTWNEFRCAMKNM
jgi:hypothetical protein